MPILYWAFQDSYYATKHHVEFLSAQTTAADVLPLTRTINAVFQSHFDIYLT